MILVWDYERSRIKLLKIENSVAMKTGEKTFVEESRDRVIFMEFVAFLFTFDIFHRQ